MVCFQGINEHRLTLQVLWTIDTTGIDQMLGILAHNGLPESGAHSDVLSKIPFNGVSEIWKCLPWAGKVLTHVLKMKKT